MSRRWPRRHKKTEKEGAHVLEQNWEGAQISKLTLRMASVVDIRLNCYSTGQHGPDHDRFRGRTGRGRSDAKDLA